MTLLRMCDACQIEVDFKDGKGNVKLKANEIQKVEVKAEFISSHCVKE